MRWARLVLGVFRSASGSQPFAYRRGVTSAGPEPSFLPVPIDTISWQGDHVRMIDQTRLPNERVEIEIRTVPEMVEAIRSLRIRGAPAIGIAAAMGLVAALRPYRDDDDGIRAKLAEFGDELAAARPTAVNRRWAVVVDVAGRHEKHGRRRCGSGSRRRRSRSSRRIGCAGGSGRPRAG